MPPLTARVTDLAGTLSSGDDQALTAKLAELEQRTGAQVAILLVPTTGADSVEHYAARVFSDWKPGRRDINDGVLLLVAKADRTIRIEVGLGLEQAIANDTAAAIIRDRMVPAFKAGDFALGLNDAIDALAPLIERAGLPAPKKASWADGPTPLAKAA